MLTQGADFNCFRESSNVSSLFIMYAYVLVTCIMLVNMLIALMAKTFDNVFEQADVQFLYLRARVSLLGVEPRSFARAAD
eukprot:493469-Prymnesium_polylepis.2